MTSSLSTPEEGARETMQEPKYRFENGRVINRASGEAIPLDEPVMVFRARDRWAAETIRRYAELVQDDAHYNIVAQRLDDFQRFATAYPERMKEPDTALAASPQLIEEPVSGPVGDERREAIAELLAELVALVRGECPSLLSEDSGGDARLSLAIDDALASLPVLRGEDKGRLRQDACAPGSDAPVGFGILPPGVRCKCIRSWRDVNGRHWCCLGPSTPISEVEASSDDGAGE